MLLSSSLMCISNLAAVESGEAVNKENSNISNGSCDLAQLGVQLGSFSVAATSKDTVLLVEMIDGALASCCFFSLVFVVIDGHQPSLLGDVSFL